MARPCSATLLAAVAVALFAAALAVDAAAQPAAFAYSKAYSNKCSRLPCSRSAYRPQQPTRPPSTAGVCPPGYGLVSSGAAATCQACASGFYSPGGRRARCLSCGPGPGFASPEKAVSAQQCVCYAGYGGPACSACLPGEYSAGTWTKGVASSSSSSGSSAQLAACSLCPPNMLGSQKPGATSVQGCGGCIEGHGGRDCAPCPAGTWSAGGSFAACKVCGANQISWPASPSADYCTCKAGFGDADGSGSCQVCPAGTFNEAPPSPPPAFEAAAAAAAAGSGEPKPLPAAGLLVAVPALLPCQPCPSNQTSPAGSTSLAACVKA